MPPMAKQRRNRERATELITVLDGMVLANSSPAPSCVCRKMLTAKRTVCSLTGCGQVPLPIFFEAGSRGGALAAEALT